MVQQLTGGGFIGTSNVTATTALAPYQTVTFGQNAAAHYYDTYPPIRYEWKYLGNETTIGGNVATKAVTEKTTHLVVNLNAGLNGAFLLDSFESEKEAVSFARRYVGQDKSAVVTVFKATKRIAAKPVETEETDL